MPKKDPRIDAYIGKSAEFAKPVLIHLRKLVHTACPDVEETLKWGMPNFMYKGMYCGMAAFKQHCVFGFWKASLMKDPHKYFSEDPKEAMGHMGKIKSKDELPPDKIMIAYLKEAAVLNDKDIKLPTRTRSVTPKKELVIPAALKSALNKNKKAKETFMNFNYTNKKEYIEWITGAKTEETRKKRLATAIEWMSEGKIQNWRYVKK